MTKQISHNHRHDYQTHIWHHMSAEKVLYTLKTHERGLSEDEVKERIKVYGLNEINFKTPHTIFHILSKQICSPLIYVLLSAAVISLFTTDIGNALVIVSVVVINSIIGFFQEYKAHKTITALESLVPDFASVIREGIKKTISKNSVVPGDIIFLQAGDKIPADIYLLSSSGLKTDESTLTGESTSAEKKPDTLERTTALADRVNMLFNGTHVVCGSALGAVVATGSQTELGKVANLIEKVPLDPTPLEKNFSKIGSAITLAIVIVSGCIFFTSWIRGSTLTEAMFSAIALAVAAIPEGFPAVITIATAIGVQRMANKKAIIRKLAAVETLGRASVICTDKTGTITENQMTVQKIVTSFGSADVTGIGYDAEGDISYTHRLAQEHVHKLLEAAILCNDASIHYTDKKHKHAIGDPTEIALLAAAKKGSFSIDDVRKEWRRVDEIPFSSEQKIMITLHEKQQNLQIFMKGSPEIVLRYCFLPSEEKERIISEMDDFARQGFRLLAFATKKGQNHSLKEFLPKDFLFLGFVSMIDPPRKEVSKSINSCLSAGITVKMITGDHPLTALKISQIVGICNSDKVITGNQLDTLSASQWKTVAEQYNVFARVSPAHKLHLVDALQKKGHVVAMTGDGINDAPALKKSDIGIAMGIRGTALAKEASDMILSSDNFSNIESAVEEGRRVYDNLLKAVKFILTTGAAQALIVFFSVIFFPINNGILAHPILPIQILWINLIVATCLAIPLAFEEKEAYIMKRPPRHQNDPLISPYSLVNILLTALGMSCASIAIYLYNTRAKTSIALPLTSKAQTLALTTLVFMQIIYMLECRSFKGVFSKISLPKNNIVIWGIAGVIALQAFFIYAPWMNQLFLSHPLSLKDIALALSTSIGLSILLYVSKKLSSMWLRKGF